MNLFLHEFVRYSFRLLCGKLSSASLEDALSPAVNCVWEFRNLTGLLVGGDIGDDDATLVVAFFFCKF
ncbi:hypothetical protein OWV82_014522 [Melia azedarach]|uniref:Uncharacterized protein n=1 Tax=Melia azedarach TaxID=155640 RepID=A0ACC1XLQ6_MELAZ|nr:hypothetical protein OWV82_014522 [Melia azedarach]